MTNHSKQIKKNMVSFVKFQKVDGTIRNMVCTVNPILIPKAKQPKGDMIYTPKQIRVFDLVAQEWRSMLEENIIEISDYAANVATRK
jgi:hypothetical protein